MRQDPDVLLIGEIRDRETAEIAIQASLTGHLVLSTLHTNDAPSAVTRLVDVGIAPYKIATAVKGVVAQRLVRRLCGCGAASRARDQKLVAEPGPTTCRDCAGDGYKGRLAIVEVLIATSDFERAVAAGESADRLSLAARDGGMRSLWESGSAHVRLGPRPRRSCCASPAPPMRVDARTPATYLPAISPHDGEMSEQGQIQVKVATVDVYVIRPLRDGWRVLVLQRAQDTRCPGSWETVHGRIEPGERPEQAAMREVQEESGLRASRAVQRHRAAVLPAKSWAS